jgi:hypothetical protein
MRPIPPLLTVAGLSIAGLFVASPALAYCGKDCRQAKDFCKAWERDHAGEECGVVRGYACTGSSWKRIKVVNAWWSACRLVKGADDLKAAEARCAEYEKVEGGTCQVHSPLCNAGWRSIGDHGKFRACRPLDPSGSLAYDGYKSFFSQVEGKANMAIPEHLHPFLKKHYTFDPASVRFGDVSKISGATCITDCNKVYCTPKNLIDQVRDGYNWQPIHFHELQHVQQCTNVGGRENYAKMWFKQIPGAVLKAIFTKDGDKFGQEVHDKMPMEKDAATKEVIHQEYVREFWHTAAKCRVVRAETNEVVYESNDTHPRVFCDPEFDREGARRLKQEAQRAAFKHGAGQYKLAFGKPHEDNGVWLATLNIANKVLAVLDFKVETEGKACPMTATVHAGIITELPGVVTYRIHYGKEVTGWRKLKTERAKILVGEGNLARVSHELPDKLGPESDGIVRIEIQNSDQAAQNKIEIKCPPLAVEKLNLSVHDGSGTSCPRDVKVKVQVVSNGPGLAPLTIEPALPGSPSSLLIGTQRVKDQYLGTHDVMLQIKDDHHQVYRAKAKNGLTSAPATIAVSCLDVAGGTLAIKQPQADSCRGEAALSLRSDVAGSIKYRLDCTGGRSWARTVKAHQTGPGTFIAIDKVPLHANNGEQVNCALKSLVSSQPKVVQLAGHLFACPTAAVSSPPTAIGSKTKAVPRVAASASSATGAKGQPQVRQCAGGRMLRARCLCPAGKTAKQGVCR